MIPVLGRGMKSNFSLVMRSSKQPEEPYPVVGYRFHPTDYELVDHFLKRKILGYDNHLLTLTEIKVCDFEPEALPGLVKPHSEDQVWYFFCPRDYKYSHGRRSNRRTKAGYWKPTGKPRKVTNKQTNKQIGTKRSLVFYIKDLKPIRTKWIMHEYEYIDPNSTVGIQGNFVLCKLKKKAEEKVDEGEPSNMASPIDLEILKLNDMIVNSSTGDEYEPSIHMASDLENFPIDDLIGDEEESRNYLGSDEENQNPNEMTTMSTNINGAVPTWDFEHQDPNNKSDISASDEGEWSSPPAAAPCDFENQNQYEKADMSISSIPANGVQEDTQQKYLDKLREFLELDKEDDHNLAQLFPPLSPSESGSYTSFDSSAGVGSEIGWGVTY